MSSPDLRCLLDKRLSVHKTDTNMTFVFSEKLSTVLVVGEVCIIILFEVCIIILVAKVNF